MKQQFSLILASASPRRRELLAQAGYTFEVIPSKKEEIITKTVPSEVVMELASQKAEDIFSSLHSNADATLLFHTDVPSPEPFLVIGADTVVSYKDRILGKPSDASDARNTLHLLSGQTHQVYTGVALYYFDPVTSAAKRHCFFEKTDVTFYSMDESEIAAYVSTGDPLDKAGSYGIQGPFAIHVKEIHGDYNNVVGLPLARLYHEMKKVLSN